MDANELLEKTAPMLDDVLGRIGLHQTGTPLNPAVIVPQLDGWLKAQAIPEEDVGFLVMIVGGFIVQYLVQVVGADALVVEARPAVRLSIIPGVAREFDPYAVAAGLIRGNRELAVFLSTVVS
ncbi:hypothetical protein [Paracidovorax wautersii]|uniref:Uncharacterized protein n=1 Tax=Paracidovorax wautersii TaxID=1177982 RepID=A0A1I2F218_9BURK|nr:hypothetical protein [Paracidovorax wautersii]SFE99033.1 hypothetical protein SAMN04489711_10951 [Paracidovorax wautersii]